MSRAVLISIRPKWVELIASGKKTVEIRKTKPNAILPIKCYIYCTKPSFPHEDFFVFDAGTDKICAFYGGGKVVGEFVCHNIFPVWPGYIGGDCLTFEEQEDYLGANGRGWGWLISDLVFYTEPMELSEFYKWWDGVNDIRPCQNGKYCEYEHFDYSEDCVACAIDFDGTDCPFLKVTRPPQSWCYVEETE